MPTLIRLFLVLVFLAGLGFAGMIGLTMMVDPGEKDITVKIPARELLPGGNEGGAIDLNDLPDPVNLAPRASSEPSLEAPADAPPPAADDGSQIETVEAPGRE
jgi:hypothetical protein